MARPKKYIISLSETDVNKLQAIIHKKGTSKSIIRRCQILLELDENNPNHLTQMQIANSFGVCKATVSNIVKDYIALGLDASITYKRNPNSNAKRKADGRDEARIIELACSQPPEGRVRWTLRLLEETSRVVLDTPIGKDAIRDILKKRNLDLT
jgi:transposase